MEVQPPKPHTTAAAFSGFGIALHWTRRRAELNRIEPNEAELNRTKPNETELDRTKPS